MRRLGVALLLSVVGTSLACSSDDDDCDAAKTELNVEPTKKLGDDCVVAYYGTCKTPFSSCAEGSCQTRPGGTPWCTTACKATTECRSGTYCVAGYCQPPASCKTTCDGATCCTYAIDPDDPTQCKQVSCMKT